MGEPREQNKASSSRSRSAMTILIACVQADASAAPEWEQSIPCSHKARLARASAASKVCSQLTHRPRATSVCAERCPPKLLFSDRIGSPFCEVRCDSPVSAEEK